MPVDHRTSQPFGMLNGGASLALAEIVAGLHTYISTNPQLEELTRKVRAGLGDKQVFRKNKPVSYTHLDVYKRQAFGSTPKNKNPTY